MRARPTAWYKLLIKIMNAARRRRINRNNRRIAARVTRRVRRRIRGVKRNVNRLRKRVRNINKNRIPAAYVPKPSIYFRIVQTTNDTLTVSGRDLVYKSREDELIPKINNVITIIPSNPAYWQGTRIATIALGYQQYRPLKFSVQYVPSVSTSKSGVIFGGTLWNSVPSEDTLEQTLTTSSGRMHTQVYKGMTAKVKLGRNLNTNLYSINGQLDVDSNPFYYVAVAKGDFKEDERSQPGLFYVTYTYSFKNPIGQSNTFSSPGLILFKELSFKPNTTVLLCESVTIKKDIIQYTLPIFTEVDVDWTDMGEVVCSYNGDVVPLGEDTKVWVFQNWNKDAFNENQLRQRFLLEFSNVETRQKSQNEEDTISSLGPLHYAVFFRRDGSLAIVINYDLDTTFDIKVKHVFWFNDVTYLALQQLDTDYNQLNQITSTYPIQTIIPYFDAGQFYFMSLINTRERRFILNGHDIFNYENNIQYLIKPKKSKSLWPGNDMYYYEEEDSEDIKPKLPKLIPKEEPKLPKLIPKNKQKYKPTYEPSMNYKGENLEESA